MTPRSAPQLLATLTARTQENIRLAEALALLPETALHQRPRPNAWNALECLAHLNFYSEYYLPEIRKQISKTKYRTNLTTFTSSWLGNKFAAGMKPGPKTRKVKTPRSANPVNFSTTVDASALTDFLAHQRDTLELLQLAATVDLTKTKTGTSLTELIRLRLGDTLRVVVNHNWRHVEQAVRASGAAETML